MTKPVKKRNKKYVPKSGTKVHMSVIQQVILSGVEEFFHSLLNKGEAVEYMGRLWIKRIGEDDYDPADTTLMFIRDLIHVVTTRLNKNFSTKALDKLITCIENKDSLHPDIIQEAYKNFEKGKQYLTQISLKEYQDVLKTAQIKYYSN